jgi:hypothetical protein
MSSALRDFWQYIVGSDPTADAKAPTEMPPTEPAPYGGDPANPQMPEIPKAPRLPDIPEPPPEGFAEPPPGGTLCSENPAQVSVDNPEIDPFDIEQNYQVDAETEEVLAKIARGEMTAEEAMSEAAADATADAATEVGTDAAVDVATDAAAETAAGEVAGEGLLASAAPVAVPVAVGVAVFLAGEDSAVPEDEEQAMLAESRRQQAAREAAAKEASGDSAPAP